MRFADIPGLDDLKETLRTAVANDHIAHAQLFLGGEGYGHLALALAYASYINCSDRQATDSCGKCASCTKYDRYIHPDLHFIFPTAATQKVAAKDAVSSAFLKEWREFLLENPYNTLNAWAKHIGAEDKQSNISKEESRNIMRTLSLRAFEAPYKVMMIWLPELMHPAASNAILKILEEPSPKTLFFLVSNSADQLLATILSRTQIVKVPPFSSEEIANVLVQKHHVEADKASYLAQLAEGSLTEAIRLSQEVRDESAAQFQVWMRLCFKADFTQMLEWAENFQRMGKEAQKALLKYAGNVVRDALIARYGGDGLLRATADHKAFVQNFAKVLNERNIPTLATLFSQAQYHIERNANAKILFLSLSIDVARAFRVKEEA